MVHLFGIAGPKHIMRNCHCNEDPLDTRPYFSYKPRISLTERTPAGDTG
jgi:hypothetical protein